MLVWVVLVRIMLMRIVAVMLVWTVLVRVVAVSRTGLRCRLRLGCRVACMAAGPNSVFVVATAGPFSLARLDLRLSAQPEGFC